MKKIKELFNGLDAIDFKIMIIGFKICFGILLLAFVLLVTYLYSNKIFLYHLGLTIFKLSTYFFIEFIICGFVVDRVKQQLN